MMNFENIDWAKRPNVIIVGAARCGTTSLVQYLIQHPSIYIPSIKEPRFFAREEILAVSAEDPIKPYLLDSSIFEQDAYMKLYSDRDMHVVRADASVHYLYHHRTVAPRIKECLGDATKIVILLRDPAQRALSHYRYNQMGARINETFDEALANESRRVELGYDMTWHYEGVGHYGLQVETYMKTFEHVKVILLEELKASPHEVMSDLFTFIGVDPSVNVNYSLVANGSGNTSSQWIGNMLFRDNAVKRLLRPLTWRVPQQTRYRVRQALRRILVKPVQASSGEADLIDILKNRYMEDRFHLESLLCRNIRVWD